MKGIFTVSIFRIIGVLTLLLVVANAWAQVDLSLSKGISATSPAVGSSVTYTLTVRNSGIESATGVVVKDSLPVDAVSYSAHQVVTGAGSYDAATGLWTIGTVAAGDSTVLEITATVNAAGVFFSVAEILAMNEADVDSRPGDGAQNQDDIAVACFSVPVEWNLGDEYTLTIPSGYKGVKWLYAGEEIVGAVVVNGKTLAVVNADSSLTVKGPGSYSFDAMVGGLCPATGCCAFEIVPAASGSIGDLVWYDDNSNGVRDENEEGVQGVTVKLFDCNNVRLATTVTDLGGRYLFSGLASGSYKVVFTQPSGSGFTNNGSVNSKGETTCITIDASLPDSSLLRNNPSVDAAIVRYASIGNYVWDDANANGEKDEDEQGIPGVTVKLINEGGQTLATIITDSNGSYLFDSLIAGTYQVKFIAPTGKRYTNGIAENGLSAPVTPDVSKGWLSPERDIRTLNAGLTDVTGLYDVAVSLALANGQLANVEPGDTVSYDLILRNAGSFPVKGIQLSSANSADLNWANALPVVNNTLNAGDSLTVSLKAVVSSEFLGEQLTASVSVLSYVSISGGTVTDSVLENNSDSVAIDVVKRYGSIGSLVWYDDNNNGVKDTDEQPAAGVTINLMNCENQKLATTITDADGNYRFSQLEAGNYQLKFIKPSNSYFTQDGSVNGAGITSCISIDTKSPDSLSYNIAINAGIVRVATIQGLVWEDVDKNGTLDSLEAGKAGVTVELLNEASAVLAFTQTNASGEYSFDSLTVGGYYVQFTAPAGEYFTNDITSEGLSSKIIIDFTQNGGDLYTKIRNAGTAPLEVSPIGNYDLAIASVLYATPAVPVQPGDTVSYVVTVRNIGDLAVSQIKLGNSLPLALQGDTEIVVDATLYPGDSTEVTGKVVVSQEFLKGTLVVTTAIRSFKNEAGNPALDHDLSNNRDSISIEVEKRYGSIGSLVWNDANSDGVQDSVETGIPGVTVQLLDTLATVLGTQVTNGVGAYLFDSLSSGAYRVKFVAPTDYKFTNGISEAGLSEIISLDVLADVNDPRRHNHAVNAGVVLVCDSISIELLSKQVLCEGDSIVLSAVSNNASASIAWYTSAESQVPTFVTANGVTIKVASTESTTFFAQATTTSGCVSDRVQLELIVGSKPAMPVIAGSFENTCPAPSMVLSNIELPVPSAEGNVFEWHTSIIPSSELVADSIPVSGSFYLFEKSSGGCYSQPALVVINTVACDCELTYGVEAGPDQEVCNQEPITVSAVLTGAAKNVVWSTNGTGVFVNQDTLVTNYLPSQDDIAAGVVTLTVTASVDSSETCSPKSDALVVTILPAPAPVYGIALDDTLICAGQSTDLVAFATSDSIRWYTDFVGGTAFATTQSGYILTVTPNETTTYYAEVATNNGCTSERVAVTLLVERCSSELAVVKNVVTPAPYTPGKRVVYSIEVTNKGEGNARDIIVEDVLPAGLIFNSSTPANAYDQNDGVWMVGSMAAQETRTLLINTVIADSAEGAITNIAVVKSSAIDSVRSFSDTSSVTIDVQYLADLSLIVKGSKSNVVLGDTVTFTAEVSNAGPLSATQVEVVAQLPAELEFVSTDHFAMSGNLLTANLDSIAKTETKQLTFQARVLENGLHTVLAQVNHSDQKDPDSTPGNGFENGEDDESSASVSAGCDSLAAPLIACAKTNVCAGATVFLTAAGCASGTVKWSNGMTGDNIKIIANETTVFTAICQKNRCISDASNSITVDVNSPEVPVLTSDMSSICASSSATLSASNCSGTVVWSTGEEAASIVVAPTESTTYTAYCKINSCVSETASITINASKPATPVVECGCSNASICPGESVLLSALQCAGVVKWSNGMSGESIIVTPGTTTDYRAVCVVNGCESDSSQIHRVKVVEPQQPVVVANKTTVCPGSTVSLSATGCAGTVVWSNNMTGDSILVKLNSSQSFSAVCKSNACASERSNTVAIRVVTPSAPIISANKSVVCSGDSVNLKALGCAGTVVWSRGQEGASVFINPTETATYTAVCKLDDCQSNVSNSVKVNVNTSGTAPVIAATKTAICVGESVAISATGCSGTVLWSNGMTGSQITVAPVPGETYYALCKVQEACPSGASNKITFDFNLSKPVTQPLINTCPAVFVNLNDAVSSTLGGGSTLVFRTGPEADAPLVANPESVGAGTYYVSERSSAGCSSEAAVIVVTAVACEDPQPQACAENPATADAGEDQRVCGAESYQLHGSIGGAATSATWSTSGTGTFSDENSLTPLYYPSSADLASGLVTLTLTTNDPDGTGACESVFDEVQLVIEAINFRPILTINGTPKTDTSMTELTICNGEFVTLAVADVEEGRYTYKWNNGTSSASNAYVVRESGIYFVSLITANGCESEKSALVKINVITPAAPITKSITNSCPATTANLATAVTNQPGVGGVFEFHTGNTLASALVENPQTVGNGSYFVFEKSAEGCYSAPSVIDVDIQDCTVEIGVALTSTAVSYNGDGSFDITYQAIIKNKGTDVLTNIEAVDSLSTTFEAAEFRVIGVPSINAGSRLSVNPAFNGSDKPNLLIPALSSLTVGKTDTLTFAVRVSPKEVEKTYYNSIITKGQIGEKVSIALSNNGVNPDIVTGEPTPVELVTEVAPIGLALAVNDTVPQIDGSYNITYQVTVKNYGSATNLSTISIINELNEVFNSGNGASFKKVGTPIVSTDSKLTVNNDFDGKTNVELLIPETSSLAAGMTDTLWFTINVKTDGREEPYLNSVTTTAKSGDQEVSDVSTVGFDPAPDDTNDPTESNEATPIVLPMIIDKVFIPEGFSPNGDGINDLFVIENTDGQRISLEVYSRWMTLVYKNDDYKNDWDGTGNSGISLGSNASGLPDGTYFYVVKLANGKRYMRSMTLTR